MIHKFVKRSIKKKKGSAYVEDLGSVPNTHTLVHNSLQIQFLEIQYTFQAFVGFWLYTVYIHTLRHKYIHINNDFK